MGTRINLRSKFGYEEKTGVDVGTLDLEEYKLYKFWRKFFGEKFAVYAAANHVWRPSDRKHETSPSVSLIYKKRIARIKYYLKHFPELKRERVIEMLDEDVATQIEMANVQEGKNISEDNIFYEVRT